MTQKPSVPDDKKRPRIKKKPSKDGIIEGCFFGIRPDGSFFLTGV